MRLAVVWVLFRKEVTETLRDRRMLFALFVLPIFLHPLLFLALGGIGAAQQAENHTLVPKVAIWGELPTAAETRLRNELHVEIIEHRSAAPAAAVVEAERLVISGKVDVVLSLPADGHERFLRDEGLDLTLYFDSVSSRSSAAHTRTRETLDGWTKEEAISRVARHGLPVWFHKPLHAENHDLSSNQRRAADIAGHAIPMVLVLVMFMAAALPAVDSTAGEKERGTLQTLLCAPIHPLEIVAGKYLTVVAMGLIAGGANLAAMGFALSRQLVALDRDLGFHLDLRVALAIFAVMIPTALLLGALLLGLSIFARSFREAQAVLTPVMLLVLVPTVAVTLMPFVQLSAATALIPFSNVALLCAALLTGHATLGQAFTVVAANCAYSVLLLGFAGRIFSTEQVLLSGERPWRDVFSGARGAATTPTPGQAVAFVAVLLVVFYYGSAALSGSGSGGIVSNLVVQQVGLMLLPALVWLVVTRCSLPASLLLRLPTRRAALGALALGLGAWSIGTVIGDVEMHFFAGARAYDAQLRGYLGHMTLGLALAISLLPALCEEVCFRGVILRGLGNSGSRTLAIIGSALAFGAAHLNLFHALPAACLGLVLGWAALASGSLLVTMFVHACNNGAVAAATRWPRLEQLSQTPWAIAVGLTLCAVGLVLLSGRRASPDQNRTPG